jgi:membrane-associated phospholipid phosphatase
MTRVRGALEERDGLVQIAVVLAAGLAYEALRALMTPDWPRALQNAREVASLERMLGISWEEPIQRAFLSVPNAVELFNAFYFLGHFVLSGLFLIWLYRREREAFRLFRDVFLVATAISVVVHWTYPTAPPRLADVGLQDTLLRFWDLDIGSPDFHGWSNPVAAVPSLHAAWAFAVAFGLLWYGGRLLRVAGVVYAPLVVLTIVVTGNHFFLDALAGLLVLGVGFVVAFWLRARRRRRAGTVLFLGPRRGVEQSGSSPGS